MHRVVEGATKQLSRRLTQGWDAIKPLGPLVSLPGIAGSLRNCAARSRRRQSPAKRRMSRQGKFHLLGAEWPAPGSHAPSSGLSGMSIPMTARCFRSAMPIASTCRSATA